jgi:hypothetical protein
MGNNVTKQVVVNAVTNIVNETNTQIVKIISQSTVNVTSHILQQQTALIQSDTSATNVINVIGINVINGTINMNQVNNLKVTVGSILNIVQTSDIVSSISTQISNDVLSQVNQSAALSAQVNAASQITKSQQTDGEANNLIDKLSNLFNFSSNTSESEIENTIISQINETSYSSTDIENYVTNAVKINVTQTTINTCLQSNSVINEFNSKQPINVYGGTLNVTQTNLINNYFSCFISSQLQSKDLQDLAAGILNQSTTSSGQGATASDTLISSLSQLTSTIEKSFLDNIQYIIIAIVICVLIAGILVVSSPFLFKAFKKTDIYKKITNSPPIEPTSIEPITTAPAPTVPTAPTSIPTVPTVQTAPASTKPTGTSRQRRLTGITKQTKVPSKLSTAIKNYKYMRVNGSNEYGIAN